MKRRETQAEGAGPIDRIFSRAEKEGRDFLLEHEVYGLLRAMGITPPRFFFVKKGGRATRKELLALKSERVVLKIVSPQIIHKSDVGGVTFSGNTVSEVNQAIVRMLAEVAARFSGAEAAGLDIRGVLVLEKVTSEDLGFGSELLLGIRNSREFGPVVTMGLGGLDVEYVNERLQDKTAVAIGSAHLLHRSQVEDILEPLAFYDKLVKDFRGRPAPVSRDTLIETFELFCRLAARFSPYSSKASFVIEEAEVNPFVVRNGRLVPLDGMCRFSRRRRSARRRLSGELQFLLHPRSIGIIGVSERMNLGHLILNNILREGFPRERTYVIKPGLTEVEACRCFPTVADLPETVDLFVLTLAAGQSVGVMAELIAAEKARSVIIIAGGIGEKEGTEGIEAEIKDLLRKGRREKEITPVVNGGNCMGIYSAPGHYDTTFLPEYKMASPGKKNPRVVYVSQSGAFMASRMNKIPEVEPLYAISLGNQIDLAASDYLDYFRTHGSASLYALYIEGFQPGDGLDLAKAAGEIVRLGKRVLIFKSGRSPEGRKATSSHTASVAGEYKVCRAIMETAGVFVAETLAEFENAVRALPALAGKTPSGNRVGLISNAGFECVVLADNLKNGFELELAPISETTRTRVAEILSPLGIERLQDIRNPLDLTPMADDAAFAACVEAFVADPNVDSAVVSPTPMTSALQTLAPSGAHSENMYDRRSVGCRLVEVISRTPKPVIVNLDAGRLYDPLAEMLESKGVPVFRRSDEALRFLGKYTQGGFRAARLRTARAQTRR